MHVPDELSARITSETNAQPVAAARALYDLDGNLAETYAIGTEPALWICTRRPGEPYAMTSLPWTEIDRLEVKQESVFSHLRWNTRERPCSLKFSSWDAPQLDALRRTWEKQAPDTTPPTASAFTPSDTTEIQPPAEIIPMPSSPVSAVVSPLELFCASINAMIETDDHIDMAELGYLSHRVKQVEAMQRGHAFLQQHGLDAILHVAPEVLDGKQAQCLFANLVAVTMLDGLLKPSEMDLLDKFQSALAISDADRQTIWDLLLTQHRLAVFAEPGLEEAPSDKLTPLVAFCASAQALFSADQQIGEIEWEFLQQAIPDPEAIQAGQRYLTTFGADHLAARAGQFLTDEQKRCLMANLYALAMIDGSIHPREQGLLDLFTATLGLPPAECEAMLDLIILKNNLGVLER